MDKEYTERLLEEAEIIYRSASGGMPGLEKWAYSSLKNGDSEIAIFIYEFVKKRNSSGASRRVWGLDGVIRREIMEGISNNFPE
jgi:hypothetical protein